MRTKVTDALTIAFFSEWSRAGYAALSLERVAKIAGAGKGALYRRWPSKAAMASDLLSQVGLAMTDTGDIGSMEADVRGLLLAIRRALRHPRYRRIIADLSAEMDREPALAAAVRPFQQARRDRTREIIERAVARGELPDTVDRDAILDLLIGPIYWRLVVSRGRMDRRQIERLVTMTTAAMRAASI